MRNALVSQTIVNDSDELRAHVSTLRMIAPIKPTFFEGRSITSHSDATLVIGLH